jgi:hypothetical protein
LQIDHLPLIYLPWPCPEGPLLRCEAVSLESKKGSFWGC